jgi:uncharacterized membrane protein
MARNQSALETPVSSRKLLRLPTLNQEAVGRVSERVARGMGTGGFLIALSVIVVVWIAWNSLMPVVAQFDPRALNFTLLTLLLSLQASYAAPLILLAQNRQDDRDRVKFEQDRQRAERNLADTEYLAREVASIRLALEDVATREFVKDELRDLMQELLAELREEKKSTKKQK